jgi:2-polyprenyl-6-methoxyphenol hydroxylase-like FAD-dependent oxidoreductase
MVTTARCAWRTSSRLTVARAPRIIHHMMKSSHVVVVGAGPTGLAVAGELALAGVPCTLLEKRANVPNITRAFGVNARTLELLDARGMADEVIARGFKVTSAQPNIGAFISLTRLDSRFRYILIVPQSGTEDVLERRCLELGVRIVRGAEVVGLAQDDEGVDVRVEGPSGPMTERASYVVACDGAHSRVRSELGAEFVGERYDVNLLLADVRLSEDPGDVVFARANAAGLQLLIPFGDGYHRSISFLHGTPPEGEPTLEEVRAASRQITGSDYGMRDARWMSRFTSERKQARHYRFGRVFLAGDAAHVHSPAGAQGMNTGIGDAMNLGWKLAAAVRGTAPSWLLDSYESERHPVGAEVLAVTDRLFRLTLIKSGALQRLVRLVVATALRVEAVQRVPRTFLSGLGVAYEPRGTAPHPLAGKRVPDLTLDGVRLAEALRRGRFVLVDTTPSGTAAREAAERYGDRIAVLAGTPKDGDRVPSVLLVRPDAYVAWAGEPGSAGAALAEWCAV